MAKGLKTVIGERFGEEAVKGDFYQYSTDVLKFATAVSLNRHFV